MHKNRLILFNSIFDKVKDSLCGCIFWVEDYLILKVKPLECQVYYASAFEVVHYLLASTVDDVSDFICNYEFLVL